MPDNYTPYSDTGIDQPIGDKMMESVDNLKERVSDVGRKAADKLERSRTATASGLEKAASALQGKADSLASGASYIRDHDLNQMMADVTTVVKNNPGPSLLLAAGLGFLVGRALSSSRS